MKNKKYIFFVLIILLNLLTYYETVSAQQINWPQFRGRNCSGIADKNEKPPIKLNDKSMFWKIELPNGQSSPCIWGDRIFITGCDKVKKELYTYCLDRITGNILWKDVLKVEKFERTNSLGSAATATPAADGERVCIYFSSYGLVCYNFAGEELWVQPLPIPKTRHGMGTSPIISNEFVYLNIEDQNDPRLLAFNKQNGELVYKQPQDSLHAYGVEGYATPIFWNDKLIIYRRGEVVAYDAKNGNKIWWFNTPTAGTSTPVVGRDMLYIGTYAGLGEPKLRSDLPTFSMLVEQNDQNGDKLISKSEFPDDLAGMLRPDWGEGKRSKVLIKPFFKKIDENSDALINSSEWSKTLEYFKGFYVEHGLVSIKTGGAGEITNTHLLWKVKKDIPEVPSPIYYNDRVYMIKHGGIVTCVKAQNGEIVYKKRLGAKGPYFSSPVVANNKIYIASRNGIISVFETGDELNILAKNNLNEKIMATPAIVDNKIYVRTAKHLSAFGE